MFKKSPPESLSPTELAFMSELNECQLRHYLAERAISLGKHGVGKIGEKMRYCKNFANFEVANNRRTICITIT